MKDTFRQIICILLLAIGVMFPYPCAAQNLEFRVEKELEHWKPAAENQQAPRDILRRPYLSLAGEWNLFAGLMGSCLVINLLNGGGDQVRFSSSGCGGGWTLYRRGAYVDGVLWLNRPVKDYFGTTYQKLYVLERKGQVFLVPDVSVTSFEKHIAAFRKIEKTTLIGVGYRREPALMFGEQETVTAQDEQVLRTVLQHFMTNTEYVDYRKFFFPELMAEKKRDDQIVLIKQRPSDEPAELATIEGIPPRPGAWRDPIPRPLWENLLQRNPGYLTPARSDKKADKQPSLPSWSDFKPPHKQIILWDNSQLNPAFDTYEGVRRIWPKFIHIKCFLQVWLPGYS